MAEQNQNQAQSQSVVKTEFQSQSQATVKTQPQPQAQVQSQPQPQPQAQVQAKVQPQPQVQSQPQVQPQSQVQTQTQAQTGSGVESEVQSEKKPSSETHVVANLTQSPESEKTSKQGSQNTNETNSNINTDKESEENKKQQGLSDNNKVDTQQPVQTQTKQDLKDDEEEIDPEKLNYEPKLYAPGAVVYRRGERANSVYMIESGEAQIFTSSKIKTIGLMELKEGSIAGTDIIYNDGVHTHSLIAKTKLIVRVYHVSEYEKMLDKIDKKTRFRLVDLDQKLEKTISRLDKALRYVDDIANNIPMLSLALQIIGIMENFPKYFVDKEQEGKGIIIIDSLLKKLSSIINVSDKGIIKVFNVLIKAGILSVRESVNYKYTILETFDKMYAFREFVNDFNSGKYPELSKHGLSDAESKLLTNIVKFCKKLELDFEKNIDIKVLDLQESLHGLSGYTWDLAVMNEACKTGLVSFKTLESINYVELCPQTVSRTICFLEAMNKLANLYEELADSQALENQTTKTKTAS